MVVALVAVGMASEAVGVGLWVLVIVLVQVLELHLFRSLTCAVLSQSRTVSPAALRCSAFHLLQHPSA